MKSSSKLPRPPTATCRELEARIARLERQAHSELGPARRAVIAEEIVLCDNGGKRRIELKVGGPRQTPTVTMFGQDGSTRIELAVDSDDLPSVSIFDDLGNKASLFGMALCLHDSCGQMRVVTGAAAEGDGFGIIDEHGRARARFIHKGNGELTIGFIDENQQHRIEIGVGSRGDHCLVLYDNKGTIRVTLGIDPDGEPRLILCDESGKPKGGLVVGESGKVGVWNNEGKPDTVYEA